MNISSLVDPSSFGDAYVKEINSLWEEKYSELSQVLLDWKDQRIDPRCFKARVNELFKGHRQLILKIHKLMPSEYPVILPLDGDDDDDDEAKDDDEEDEDDEDDPYRLELVFCKKVKLVFKDKMDKYYEFLQVLNSVNDPRLDAKDVCKIMRELFKGRTNLVLGFNKFIPLEFQITLDQSHYQLVMNHEFLDTVKLVFHDKMEKYFEFLQVIEDHNTLGIDARGVAAVAKELFEGHTNLILGFNKYSPKEYQITLPFEHKSGKEVKLFKKAKKVASNCQLPSDVLDIIFKFLDFDDLFQLACVCKDWRAFHKISWRNFLAFQEPLLVKMSSHVKKSFSFISVPNQKIYHSNMINYFWHFAYCGSSSGYLIMTGNNNSFLLINPFTRRKRVVNTSSAFKAKFSRFAYRVLLAFDKGSSEEFVLVALCKSSNSLYVYQSRNLCWVTYSTDGHPWVIVDFVVLHNTIYVVTNKANIGVLSLNSANIKFLKLESTPFRTSASNLNLVSCDGQLLLVHTKYRAYFFIMYTIDLSTMKYVKMESLGDMALFYAPGGNYYTLSNSERWGYERNSVYAIKNHSSPKCEVYVGDDNKLPEYIRPSGDFYNGRGRFYLLDWCFRHIHYEVDYSLVE